MRKPDFYLCENKVQISCAVTAQLISAFVQFLFFLNLKFQAYIHLLYLHRPVCVRPGWKPRRPVFSRHDSYFIQCFFCIFFNFLCFISGHGLELNFKTAMKILHLFRMLLKAIRIPLNLLLLKLLR